MTVDMNRRAFGLALGVTGVMAGCATAPRASAGSVTERPYGVLAD